MGTWEQMKKIGEAGENTIQGAAETLGYTVHKVPLEVNLMGIDQLWERDSMAYSVEIKTDSIAATSSNIFCELQQRKSEGWTYNSLAQKLAYFVTPGTLYIFQMTDIKDRLEAWRKEYPTVSTSGGSTGVLVPLPMLRRELNPEIYAIPV